MTSNSTIDTGNLLLRFMMLPPDSHIWLSEKVFLPSCGGVDIGINITASDFARERTGRLATTRRSLLSARPSPDALYWDFDPNARVDVPVEPRPESAPVLPLQGADRPDLQVEGFVRISQAVRGQSLSEPTRSEGVENVDYPVNRPPV